MSKPNLPNPSVAGGSVVMSANVFAAGLLPPALPLVIVFEYAPPSITGAWVEIGRASVDNAGQALLNVGFPNPGSYPTRARFPAQGNFLESSSSPQIQVVSGGAPPPPPGPPPPPPGLVGTTLTIGVVTPEPSNTNQEIAVPATLTRNDTGAPISGALVTFEGSDDNGVTWWFAGGYITDAAGISHGKTVFTWPGAKLLHAIFAATGNFGASKSSDQPHTVIGPAPPPPPPPGPPPPPAPPPPPPPLPPPPPPPLPPPPPPPPPPIPPPPPPPAAVPTNLTLALVPNPAVPNQTVTAAGRLTRADTGAPLPSQTIIIERQDVTILWGEIARTVTDASGAFTQQILFAGPGSVPIRARFAGA